MRGRGVFNISVNNSLFAHENMGKLVKIFAGLLIVALDIVAGILGYKAEAAQNQVHHSN